MEGHIAGEFDEIAYLTEYIKESAKEYIASLPRDKRVIASRYVFKFRDTPKTPADMGFCQYLQKKMMTGDTEG